MLVEFSVANHRAVRERLTLSMVPYSDPDGRRAASEHAIETGHPAIPHLLPDACILGVNGSGKTSLLSAMDAMADIVNSSAKQKAGSKIDVEPFALERGWDRRPSAFEATFLCGGAAYRYGFEATRNRVTGEWLAVHAAMAKDWSVLLERTWIPKTKKHEVSYAARTKRGSPEWLSKTRPNALLLSAAANAGAGGHLERAHAWLTGQLGTLNASVPIATPLPMGLRLRKAQWRKRIVEFCGDLGVRLRGLEIEEYHTADMVTLDDVPSPFREILLSTGATLDSIKEMYRQAQPDSVMVDVRLLHKDGGSAAIPVKSESSEIQTVNGLAGPVLCALDAGCVLAVDNLGAKLSPTAVESLIEMFREPAINPNGAQIIFTTRDPANGREAFFERDEVWIMEREHDGQASLRCETNVEGARGVGSLVEDHLGGGRRSML